MQTTITQPSVSGTVPEFDIFEFDELPNRLRAVVEYRLWSHIHTACDPRGFRSGVSFSQESLEHNTKNHVRMSVVAPKGHRYTIVLTEHEEDGNNFHGHIVQLGGDDLSVDLTDNLCIPVRLYYGDSAMYVKFNSGRVV